MRTTIYVSITISCLCIIFTSVNGDKDQGFTTRRKTTSTVAKTTTTTTTKTATTTTTKTTTTPKWIKQKEDGTYFCYGGGSNDNILDIHFDQMIDTSLADFDYYFVTLPSITTANAYKCSSKCGATGTYSACIAFDYDIQTKICNMYAIKTETRNYYVYGKGFTYYIYNAQPEFLSGYNNITYLTEKSNHLTAILNGDNGNFEITY